MASGGNDRQRPTAAVALAIAALVGCGARTALSVEPPGDGGTDAPSRDAGLDAPVCVPTPSETCNGRDDDCDGVVDEGLGIAPLGPPLVVRENEIITGDCTSCSWAFEPVLAPLDGDEHLVMFRVGIYGGAEMDNIGSRRIDSLGVPLESVRTMPAQVLLETRTLRASRGAGEPTYVGVAIRSTTGRTDGNGWMTVGRDGEISVRRWARDDAPVPIAIAADHLMAVSTDSRRAIRFHSSPIGGDGSVDVLEVEVDEVLTAFSASGANDTVLGSVVLTYVDEVHALRWLSISPPSAVVADHALDFPYDAYPHLVGTSEGFLFVQPGDRDESAQIAVLDANGYVVSPLRPAPDLGGALESDLSMVITHHPRAPELVVVQGNPREGGALHVVRIDEAGDVLAAWHGEAPGYVVYPEVSWLDDGRMMVAWNDIAPDSTPSRVYVQPFGCAE